MWTRAVVSMAAGTAMALAADVGVVRAQAAPAAAHDLMPAPARLEWQAGQLVVDARFTPRCRRRRRSADRRGPGPRPAPPGDRRPGVSRPRAGGCEGHPGRRGHGRGPGRPGGGRGRILRAHGHAQAGAHHRRRRRSACCAAWRRSCSWSREDAGRVVVPAVPHLRPAPLPLARPHARPLPPLGARRDGQADARRHGVGASSTSCTGTSARTRASASRARSSRSSTSSAPTGTSTRRTRSATSSPTRASAGSASCPSSTCPATPRAGWSAIPSSASLPGPFTLVREWGIFDNVARPLQGGGLHLPRQFFGEMAGALPGRLHAHRRGRGHAAPVERERARPGLHLPPGTSTAPTASRPTSTSA